ncbi:MAG: hypothetical protein AMJ73_01835 [candidate division Zixibacteria bacterium SM1_73]|nr:MAG: hypothetical protein AMJ73_01835 [candidate division Zixibacteria bacterium SM1_73]
MRSQFSIYLVCWEIFSYTAAYITLYSSLIYQNHLNFDGARDTSPVIGESYMRGNKVQFQKIEFFSHLSCHHHLMDGHTHLSGWEGDRG